MTSVYGRRDVEADEVGVVDLTPYAAADLEQGVGALAGAGRRPGGFAPTIVEVEGVRSLARATVVVAWLGGRRLMTWLRPRRPARG